MIALLLSFALAAPPGFEALNAEANQAREAGRTEEAIRLYSRAVRLRPAATESWWYLGLCYYEKDRYPEAAKAFTEVTRAQPKQGAGWAMLGLSMAGAKNHEAALKALAQAHALGVPSFNNLDRIARYHYAALLNRAGQFEVSSGLLMTFVSSSAVTPLVKQVAGISALRMQLLPEEVPAAKAEAVRLAGEASVLAWQKRGAEARREAQTLLEKYPDQPNAHYLMGYLLLVEKNPQCLDEFRKELERDPAHIPARLQIAYEYFQRSEFEKALPYAAEAAKLEPGNFVAHNVYGRILLGLDRLPEATRELETAVRLEPDSPEAHFHLASAYSRNGRKEEAAKHRELFAKLDKERQK